MRIAAAVIRSPGKPFTIEQVDLEEPNDDEVLVQVAAAGLSHIDLLARDQGYPMPLPAVLGREASGIVIRTGARVTRVAPGESVILTFDSGTLLPGHARGSSLYGPDWFGRNISGRRADGSSPLAQHGKGISGMFFGQSSHAEHAVAIDRNVVRIPNEIPADVAAALGGDVMIGAGAVINAIRPRPESSIAIFGAGAIGLGATMAAKIVGCNPIIAVDIKASRLELAESVGATHTLDPDGLDAVDAIRSITGGGADYVIEAAGQPGVVRHAVASLAPNGVCVLANGVPLGAEATFDMSAVLSGRTVHGAFLGDSVPDTLIPRLVALHGRGRFPVDRLLARYPLAHINQAAEDILSGAAVKPILMMR